MVSVCTRAVREAFGLSSLLRYHPLRMAPYPLRECILLLRTGLPSTRICEPTTSTVIDVVSAAAGSAHSASTNRHAHTCTARLISERSHHRITVIHMQDCESMKATARGAFECRWQRVPRGDTRRRHRAALASSRALLVH
jgi:hypothetical protein